MTLISVDEKKQTILDYEESTARQLARKVLDKPTPPVWMILIPIFFVFYGWKLKQYGNGLKDFAEHYLLSRRRALDAAVEAAGKGQDPDIDELLEQASHIPLTARPLYREWIVILIDHYRGLLAGRGSNRSSLVRSCYQSKSNYLLFCNQLNKAEHTYNQALLPDIDGDRQDLQEVIDKMNQAITELRRLETIEIFS